MPTTPFLSRGRISEVDGVDKHSHMDKLIVTIQFYRLLSMDKGAWPFETLSYYVKDKSKSSRQI